MDVIVFMVIVIVILIAASHGEVPDMLPGASTRAVKRRRRQGR